MSTIIGKKIELGQKKKTAKGIQILTSKLLNNFLKCTSSIEFKF